MAKLTAAAVRRALVPGRYGDGDTLYLNVTPSGTKSWIQRIVIDGRRHDIGLGPYPLISLAHARERAIENRLAIANGRNPLAEKRRTRIPTFRKAAEATFQANLPRWRDGKTAKNWMQG
ncbi:MAG: Arm DNA-binding domain-containing protein, partial [Gammaproteobacteria bacterium]|nr:Arm DNA-binding domain-containing protein [Gammaproteobacteria bacterium]